MWYNTKVAKWKSSKEVFGWVKKVLKKLKKILKKILDKQQNVWYNE